MSSALPASPTRPSALSLASLVLVVLCVVPVGLDFVFGYIGSTTKDRMVAYLGAELMTQSIAGAGIASLELVVVLFLWLGRNWARRLTLIASLLVLWQFLALPDHIAIFSTQLTEPAFKVVGLVTQIALSPIKTVFYAWLLVWLNSHEAVEYFR